MSVTVNVQMNGDLNNSRHREVAKEIAEAVQAVIQKQPDLAYAPTVSVSESKTTYQVRYPFSETEFRDQGSGQTIVVNTVYHINQ